MTQHQAIANACYEGNNLINKMNKGKEFEYTLLDTDFVAKSTGRCTDVVRHYSSVDDYSTISYTDIETGKRHSVCQFYIRLKECK